MQPLQNSASEKNDTQLVISRNKRSPIFPKINLDNVIGTIFGVKGWPAMLTNQVGWVSFRIFGYIVGGKYTFLCQHKPCLLYTSPSPRD